MRGPLDFIEAFEYEFMQRALIASVIIGIVCAIIGVFVLLKGMIFIGEAISHAAFAGAALGLLLGLNDPIFYITLFGTGTAIVIGLVNEKQVMKNDVIIGVAFTFFMGLAIIFISLMTVYRTSINTILFGNVLLITQRNYTLLLIVGILMVIGVLAFSKELHFITFDPEMARASGIPVKLINLLFLIMVSFTINLSIRAIGAILVFAMIVTPAAAAYQWTYNINRMLFISAVFGALSSILGLYFSYALDIPTGSSIVVTATTIFVISFILSPKRKATGSAIIDCKFCKKHFDEQECGECDFHIAKHIHVDGRTFVRKQDIPEVASDPHNHMTEEKSND